MIEKKYTVFVGAFRAPKGGALGGQLYACQTLLESELGRRVNFHLVDTTMVCVPPPPVFKRIVPSLTRLVKFIFLISRPSSRSALIFTGAGVGFFEKGLMVFSAGLFNKKVYLFPRSGLISRDIDSSRFFRFFSILVIKSSDRVVCQGSIWSDFYQNLSGLPSCRFLVVKNWIDPLPYVSLPLLRRFDSKILTILFIGWIEKNKGIYEFMDSIISSKEMKENKRYIICGDGSELESIKEITKLKGLSDFISFKGWVSGEKKFEILKQSNILVIPSHREGLPNVMLEGMASGCCVVASSVGAIPDVITDGYDGVMIPPFNSSAITSSVLKLAKSEANMRRISSNARNTILSNHDVRTSWRKIFNLIAT